VNPLTLGDPAEILLRLSKGLGKGPSKGKLLVTGVGLGSYRWLNVSKSSPAAGLGERDKGCPHVGNPLNS